MEHILKKSAHPIGVEGPVLTIVMDGVGIGNGKNAGYLAAHIVAIADPAVREKLVAYRKSLGDIEV